MMSRILTALALMIPVIYLIGWSPEWLFLLALLVTVERALFEYFHISRQAGFRTFPALGYVGAGLLCLAQAAELRKPGAWTCVVLALIVLFMLGLALRWAKDLRQYLGAVATTVFGMLYVGFTLSLLIPLRFSAPSRGPRLVFLLFLVIWAGDIGAFLIGRSLGRHPLSPRLSPKKTVEGALGGLAASLLVAFAFARLFWRTEDLKTIMLLSGLIAVAGQVGDLAESALKRCADLKDSAAILPGHGGLLDRIDSLLFAAPTLWLALALMNLWPL
jgi:phosphatidate cytidylyltransferase